MNTHSEYRRHMHQPAAEQPIGEISQAVENHLAVGRDLSLNAASPKTATGRRVAWVRPTELHTFVNPIIGRGIDLHAELMQRARQEPRRVGRATRRLAQAHQSPALDSTT